MQRFIIKKLETENSNCFQTVAFLAYFIPNLETDNRPTYSQLQIKKATFEFGSAVIRLVCRCLFTNSERSVGHSWRGLVWVTK